MGFFGSLWNAVKSVTPIGWLEAGADILGGTVNAIQQNSANKENFRFQREQASLNRDRKSVV